MGCFVVSHGQGKQVGGRKCSAILGRLVKGIGGSIWDTHGVIKTERFTTHLHVFIFKGYWAS